MSMEKRRSPKQNILCTFNLRLVFNGKCLFFPIRKDNTFTY